MFEIVAKDLKTVYGAESVARWGLLAFMHRKKELDETCGFVTTYLSHLDAAAKSLLLARSEPVLHNVLKYIYPRKELQKKKLFEIKKEIELRANKIQHHINRVPQLIASIAVKKIKHKHVIYTHGYSSTVELVLRKVAAHDRSIKVNITETRPLFHGKVLAENLITSKIKVKYYLDVSMAEAIKNSDIVLIGCIGADSKGFYHRAGADMVAHFAKFYRKPLYICTDTLKISSSVSLHSLENIDLLQESKYSSVHNTAFNCIDPNFVTGVICEEGILKPQEFLKHNIFK